MASVVDLTEAEDDGILEICEVSSDEKTSKDNNRRRRRRDTLFKQLIVKCLSLENSDGMHKVINNSLIEAYNVASQQFKESEDFKKTLQRSLTLIEKDPSHKYSHIKDLRDILVASVVKKRIKPITLTYDIKDKKRKNCNKTNLDNEIKKPNKNSLKSGVMFDKESNIKESNHTIDITREDNSPILIEDKGPLDLDIVLCETSIEQSPNKTCLNSVVMFDKENKIKEGNHTKDITREEKSPVLIEDNGPLDSDIVICDTPIEKSDNAMNVLKIDLSEDEENSVTITEESHQISEVNENTLMDWSESKQNSDYQEPQDKTTKINFVSNTNLSEISKESKKNDVIDISQEDNPDLQNPFEEGRYLIPQAVVETSDYVGTDSKTAEIFIIEKEIAHIKMKLMELDEQEVTSDNSSSPYLKSDRLKAKIVELYKKLCELTGNTPRISRRIHLKVMNGHPKGPIQRLENLLNENIVNDKITFPDFMDVINCVTKANEEDGLGLTKQQMLQEAALIFTHCGRELQKMRQQREWEDVLSTVEHKELKDPADENPELLARLQQNKLIADRNESDILERYSNIQNSLAQINDNCSDTSNNHNREIVTKDFNTLNKNTPILNNIEVNQSSDTTENTLHVTEDDVIYLNTLKQGERAIVNNEVLFNSDDESSNVSYEDSEGVVNKRGVNNNLENSNEACLSARDSSEEISAKNELSKDLDKSKEKIDFNAVTIKQEKTDDIIKLLNELGPNHTATIFDIYDPFLVIELSSDSSDDEWE